MTTSARLPFVVDDIIVVGSGMAGLITALLLAPRPVTLITKTPQLESGSSLWAKGGIAGAEASLGKLVGAFMNQEIADFTCQLFGQAGIIQDPQLSPESAHFQDSVLFSPGVRLAGGTDEVDARSDIWAVGIILWELCTGRHPLAPLSHERFIAIADPERAL